MKFRDLGAYVTPGNPQTSKPAVVIVPISDEKVTIAVEPTSDDPDVQESVDVWDGTGAEPNGPYFRLET